MIEPDKMAEFVRGAVRERSLAEAAGFGAESHFLGKPYRRLELAAKLKAALNA